MALLLPREQIEKRKCLLLLDLGDGPRQNNTDMSSLACTLDRDGFGFGFYLSEWGFEAATKGWEGSQNRVLKR